MRGITLGALLLLSLPLTGGPAAAAESVAPPFRAYYDQHQGLRVLGHPLAGLGQVAAFPAQYFEKGRIEDHRAETANPVWMFMYGRLTVELMDRLPDGAVSSTNLTYGALAQAAAAERRTPPPAGFRGGTMAVPGGRFVPFDAGLGVAPGQVVPSYFWAYLTRADLFPGGWLHDIGLPLTGALDARVVKNGQARAIAVQAFERTVLTYDPANPADWRVERGNIGADALYTPIVPARVEVPAVGARTTVPLHVQVRTSRAGEQVTAVLRWRDGTALDDTLTTIRGEDGRGLLIANLNFKHEGPPPAPPTQPATLTLYDEAGLVLAERTVTMLGNNDPNTMQLKIYWVLPDDPAGVRSVLVRIPRTQMVGTAALQELLWGPAPPNMAGFETALPTPQQVINYPGRAADWGPRVTLRSLTIVNGVATADFSKEMWAYGGGSLRVKLIHDQVANTLLQFPTVHQVRIAINGQLDALQP
jgi:hypothetical protein